MTVASSFFIHVLARFGVTAGTLHCLALYLASLEAVAEVFGKAKDSRMSEDHQVMSCPCRHF